MPAPVPQAGTAHSRSGRPPPGRPFLAGSCDPWTRSSAGVPIAGPCFRYIGKLQFKQRRTSASTPLQCRLTLPASPPPGFTPPASPFLLYSNQRLRQPRRHHHLVVVFPGPGAPSSTEARDAQRRSPPSAKPLRRPCQVHLRRPLLALIESKGALLVPLERLDPASLALTHAAPLDAAPGPPPISSVGPDARPCRPPLSSSWAKARSCLSRELRFRFRVVRIRSTTSVCLLHGLVLLPCGISACRCR
ncbi:uncharacterized protein [Triticum aestivum]|uniref:uncharacterized protein n=1 Tax=Triticum aestivum TaxID=4565 RepID=UPI001D008E36|nr:uncharacterized protein LOC123189657 [Triticum aestivum]